MHKISIIIPTYNSDSEIQFCFDSLIKQTINFDNLEIIFVDGHSTDDSWHQINKLSSNYSNVFGFQTKTYSSYTGEQKNIGLKKATSPYIIFLNPNCILNKFCCELLFNIIVEKEAELVSGNYKISNDKNPNFYSKKIGKNDSKYPNGFIEIKNISEEKNLLNNNQIISSKIFKKEFLVNNNLFFEENIPSEDLIFITQSLLESKGIIYLNNTIVKYDNSKDLENITPQLNKKRLSKLLETYTIFYELLKSKYPHYANLALKNLDFWTNELIWSNLSKKDIWDLLNISWFLIKELNHSNMSILQKNKEIFYKLIEEKKYFNAINLINLLRIEQDNDLIESKIKSKEIISIFFGFDYNIGGLAKALFNRSNVLADNGHSVLAINMDTYINYGNNILENNYKNINDIEKQFRKLGYISDKVKFINVFEYYREKNSINQLSNINNELDDMNIITVTENYIIQKNEKKGNVTILNFFNKKDFTKNEINLIQSLYKKPFTEEINEISIAKTFNKNIIKTENYVNNILNVVTIHGEKDIFYTNDGFIYLEIIKKTFEYILYDRETGLKIVLKTLKKFINNFIEEICLKCSEKPFLINECSGELPSIEGIPSDFAYKIGWIHTNPYFKPYCYGSPLRNMSVLSDLNQIDAIVTLTEGAKKDLIKELNINNIYSLPNMLDLENFAKEEEIEKNSKKISIFARISPDKNIGDAIKAFKIVHNKHPSATLNIYGRALRPQEQEEFDKLQKLVHDLELENTVIFQGHVTNVYKEMKNSLATLFISDAEGLGLVVIESMLNKTPVISYKIHYGPEELIKNEIDGILVNQYDVETLAKKIIYLLDNPNIAIEMGEIAQKNISKKFSSEKLYSQLFEMLKEIYLNSEVRVTEKILPSKNISINRYNEINAEKKELIKQNNQIKTEKEELIKQNNQIIKNSQKIIAKNDELIWQKNQIEIINDNSRKTIEFYKFKNKLYQKILSFLPYLYIIYVHKEIILNLKLYKKLQKNDWFDIGYYINENTDLSRRKWCEILTPQTHYVCYGFNEKRNPNAHYINNLSKKELIKYIK